MADKYYRLVTFVVNICPKPMRELFVDQAKSSPTGQVYTTLDVYLAHRKQDVMKLRHKKLLRQDQYDLMYPPNGQADEETWDITLLSLLLENLFQNKITTVIPNITTIREIRNNLQHISGTAKVTDADFTFIWSKLETATLAIANFTKGSLYEDEIRKEIVKTKNSVITCIGDILRLWYSAHIVELKDEMEQLKQKIDEIQATTTKTQMTVNAALRKRERQDGTSYKWVNTTPPLEQMRSSFELTLARHIQNYQCQSTNEMDRILTELHTKHFALVSGIGQSFYLQTTLSAIKKVYEMDRCVLVSCASDWVHVGSEEISLALFIDPFGKDELSQEKSREMMKLLDNVKQITKDEKNGEVVDVVMVTDHTVFNALTAKYSHDLLEHPIILFEETSESSPAVIDSEMMSLEESDNDPNYRNLLVQSIAYYRQHNMKYPDENTIQRAETMFRRKKKLTICGPRGCGKTTLALHLLTHYQEGHYLIINEPEDIAHVRFGVTCVIIIEDLCGKYDYDTHLAFKWFRKFDFIYPLVKQGKLKVVITCEGRMLKRLQKGISKHPLLKNVLTLRKVGAFRHVRVKQEPGSEPAGFSATAGSSVVARPQHAVLFNCETPAFVVKTVNNDGVSYTCRITRICKNPDGTVFVLYEDSLSKTSIAHLDVNLKEIRRYPDEGDEQDAFDLNYARDICCTQTGKLVVLTRDKIQVFKVENKLLLQNTVADCGLDRVFSCGDKIVAMHAMYRSVISLRLYDPNLRFQCNYTYPNHEHYDDDKLYDSSTEPLDQGNHIFSSHQDWIFSININQKQMKFHRFEDKFFPKCTCRCEEDGVLVLGEHLRGDDQFGLPGKRMYWRILHLNKDLDILSDFILGQRPKVHNYGDMSMIYNREQHMILVAFAGRIFTAHYDLHE